MKMTSETLMQVRIGVLAASCGLVFVGSPSLAASQGGMEFYSVFALTLNDTCSDGFSSKSKRALESKGYCMGFLYAVITKMEADGTACFGANISAPVEEASRLLSAAPHKAVSWDILEQGFRAKFPCS